MKYFKLTELGMKRVFTYKKGIFLTVLSSLASIFILQRFWHALYRNDTSMYLYMVNYSIMSQILGIMYRINAPNMLSNRIRTGNISIELLRPWEYINAMLFEDAGTILGNLLTSGAVLFIAAKIFFHTAIPSVLNIAIFLLSALLGYVLLSLIKILVGMACFWMWEAYSLLYLMDVVIQLLSGQFLPSWIVPQWLENIMNNLPFIWIYQKPISMYIGAAAGETVLGMDYLYNLLFQLGWIIILYIAVYVIWRIAVNKLSVQGG